VVLTKNHKIQPQILGVNLKYHF